MIVKLLPSLVPSYWGTPTFLAKTKETFKLADLQYLEAEIQAQDRYDCQRQVLDAATGSSVLELRTFEHSWQDDWFLASSLQSCDWVGQVMCCGANAPIFLNNLVTAVQYDQFCTLEEWTLRYVRFGTHQRPLDDELPYTPKGLMFCTAEKLPLSAALNEKDALDHLLLVDMDGAIHLVRQVDLPSSAENDSSAILADNIGKRKKVWSQRPFPYSSATNYEVADMILNILHHQLVQQKGKKPVRPFHLLDPTCGSGTFLALGLYRNMTVTGWDSNALCVQGSERNLRAVFRDDAIDRRVKLWHQSCCAEGPNGGAVDNESMMVDAIACNLPWGLNSELNTTHEEDGRDAIVDLLSGIRNSVPAGIPCAFVHKAEQVRGAGDSNASYTAQRSFWKEAGFRIIGCAQIPQAGFQLPRKGKNQKASGKLSYHVNGRNHCIVSLVETI